jgi:hypothetical protein
MAAVCPLAFVISQAGTAQAAGSTWSIVPSPNKGSTDQLAGLSCISSAFCVAVGYYTNSSNLPFTLIESWNGTRWTIMPSPNKGDDGGVLRAVSCALPTSCEAVGDYGTASGKVGTLGESWNGTSWSVSPTPSPSKRLSSLIGVTCTASSYCVAVGTYGFKHGKALIETWNGTTWTVVASNGPPDAVLGGVSCIRKTQCTAVGSYKKGTLVESWNGTSWSVSPSPNDGSDSLSGVSCATSTSCMAVGSRFAKGNFKPLIESLNGTAWSIVRSPSFRAHIVFLDGVSCTSSTSCIAVGSSDETLIESWNGKTWSMVSSPNKGEGGVLSEVTCTSSTSCVAVGAFYKDSTVTKTLVEAT